MFKRKIPQINAFFPFLSAKYTSASNSKIFFTELKLVSALDEAVK